CLHHLRMALAKKSVLFGTELWHASSQTHTTWAWGKINAIELTVKNHAAVYRACHRAMISLKADEDTLVRYRVLEKEHLKVSTPVSDPNAQGHRDSTLAWFWTMDVQRDAELNDWMSEFYRGHWLRTKALKDRWEEEVEHLRVTYCLAHPIPAGQLSLGLSHSYRSPLPWPIQHLQA
ncbi:hypothetical protein PAXRUDRAFT_166135, partial [Paxillus rubicundulus Ve08.2h10]